MSEAFKMGLALAFKDGLSLAATRAEIHLQSLETAMAHSGTTLLELANIAKALDNVRHHLNMSRSSLQKDTDESGNPATETSPVLRLTGTSNSFVTGQWTTNKIPDPYTSKVLKLTAPANSQPKQVVKVLKPSQRSIDSSTQISGVGIKLPLDISAARQAQVLNGQQAERNSFQHLSLNPATPTFNGGNLSPTQMTQPNNSSSTRTATAHPLDISLSAMSANDDQGSFAPANVDLSLINTASPVLLDGQAQHLFPYSEADRMKSTLLGTSAPSTQENLIGQRIARNPIFSESPNNMSQDFDVKLSRDTPNAPTFFRRSAENTEQRLSAHQRGAFPNTYPSVSDIPPSNPWQKNGSATSLSMHEQIGGSQEIPDAKELQQDSQGMIGDIFLDGALVGRWMSRLLTKEAERASTGPTGYDMRRGSYSSAPSVAM